jgi:hypothetical protein
VSTGEQGHTAEGIAEDIERFIKKNDKTDVAGVVTDKISANKKAWKLLKAKFPGKFFQECASHGLHLMVKDILYPSKREKEAQKHAKVSMLVKPAPTR